jgi:hypothetical protein
LAEDETGDGKLAKVLLVLLALDTRQLESGSGDAIVEAISSIERTTAV